MTAVAATDVATRTYAIGVDIGGTFTDCSVLDERDGTITTAKVPTTPDNPSEGFFAAIAGAAERLGLSEKGLLAIASRVVHGTTRGTNAIVARHGVSVGLITTAGHRDVMYLMKGGGRTSGLSADVLLHVPSTNKPDPIVPKNLIVEVPERVDVDGDVVVPINKAAALAGIRHLVDQGVDSIAVSFLWSIKNPVHEALVRDWIRETVPGVHVSCAHELCSQIGEYGRTTTAVMNAYIGPLMVKYVADIERGAKDRGYHGGVLFTQCAGGAITGEEARHAPIRTVQSGPVSGVVGSAFLARRLDIDDVIATDMGGTTFDVSVIRAKEPLSRDVSIFERYQLSLPMLDVESVGAGGGSIAWLDGSGRLQVGPQSAGAHPGPACYGKGGTEATVTDADVVLGVIDPDNFLHGKMTIDRRLAEEAVERLARRLGMGVLETAAGINRIVDSKMADLIRRMSVLRGFDPREFVCFAFGGGGPVHAGAVAREAGLKRTIVPLLNVAPVWSALGAATSDIVHVYQEAKLFDMPAPPDAVTAIFQRLEQRARQTLDAEGFDSRQMTIRRTLRMKYAVQVHDVEVPVREGRLGGEDIEEIAGRFTMIYEDLFGKGAGYREGGVQVTSFQVRATWQVDKPALAEVPLDGTDAVRTSRRVYWEEIGETVDTPVLRLTSGRPDGRFPGPLLIDLPDTVVVVRPGQHAWFDNVGNLILDHS